MIHLSDVEWSSSTQLQVVSRGTARQLTARVTAYCSCEICCGTWAQGRELDSNGVEIVKGSAGIRLVPGYSVAAPKGIELGSIVYIDGKEYRVDDRTADWVQDKYGPTFDIYMGDHEDALEFGSKKMEVNF